MTSNSDDLDTADIATRVHNTRPHQAKVYSPIFRHGQTGNVEDLHNGAPDDIKFFNSGRDANQPLSKHHSQGHTNNNSNKHRKEKVPVEEVITQHHLEEETTVQTAEKVFKKVAKKLAGIVERDEQVKVVAGLLLRLRQQYALDDAVLSEVLRWGLLQLLLTSSEKIFKFEHLAEEALNCMLPLVRAPDLRARATTCLVKAGAITFSMTSIRLFHKSNANIRVLALELLASLVDFVVGCHARGARDVGSSLGKFVAKNYVVHHLLLHGAASSFPSLLSLAIQTNSDLSVQRTLRCLTFVLTETPPDLSVTVAMSNRWGLLRDLLHCIRAGGSAGVKVQAAVLLTGLLASSAVVAEKLVDMQGWDDLSTALVSPALDFSSMPEAWLERSMDTMKLMQTRHVSRKVIIPQQSLSQKFAFINFEPSAADDSASDFDRITRELDLGLDASTGEDSGGGRGRGQRLAALPGTFWPQTSPGVMRDELHEGRMADMKTRLQSSPFGDPRTILEQNERRKTSARASQEKLRRGESRLLQNPRPDRVLRSSQRKKVYPSQLLHEAQQQERERELKQRGGAGSERHHEVEVPADTVQSKEVAEQLFSSAPAGLAGTGKEAEKEGTAGARALPSSMELLSYAERLQVMILHCQDSRNYLAEEESEIE